MGLHQYSDQKAKYDLKLYVLCIEKHKNIYLINIYVKSIIMPLSRSYILKQ